MQVSLWCEQILHVPLTTVAKIEVACLRHPEASTIGSHLLDEDCSRGWLEILETQPWAPMQKEEQAPVTLLKQWTEEGKGGERGTAWVMELPLQNRQKNAYCTCATLQSISTWNSNTCICVDTADCLGVKLHLTACSCSKYHLMYLENAFAISV